MNTWSGGAFTQADPLYDNISAVAADVMVTSDKSFIPADRDTCPLLTVIPVPAVISAWICELLRPSKVISSLATWLTVKLPPPVMF